MNFMNIGWMCADGKHSYLFQDHIIDKPDLTNGGSA